MSAIALVLAAAGAGLQNGNATPSTKYYATTIGGTPAAGATFTAHITLTNSSSSSQSLGSENVAVPLGFTAAAGATPAAPAGKTWKKVTIGSLQLSDGAHQVIQLRANSNSDALAPGQSVTADVSVTVPCTLPADTKWKTEAKQSNDFSGQPGNDFLSTVGTLDNASRYYSLPSPTSTGSCGYRFVNADLTTTWTPDSGGYRAGIGFTVRLEAVDGNGAQRTSYNGSATFSGLSDALTGATPTYSSTDDGSHTVAFTAGLAATTVTGVRAETSRQLTATDTADSHISATSAAFDVWPGTPAALTIGHVADTAVNVAISPSVTADVYDGFGNKESCATCTQPYVSLALAHDAGSGTGLTGNGATQSVLGTATFANVKLDQSGSGFTLKATMPTSIESSASNGFTVYDNLCNQSTNPSGYTTCSATKNGTSITTDYGTPTVDPTLFQLSGPNQSLNCGSLTTARGAIVTFVPAGKDTTGTAYTYRNPVAVTLRWDKTLVPGTGVSNFTLCLAKPFDAPGWTANTYQVVQDCPAKLKSTTVLPCASKRSRNNAGDLVIVLLMGSGDPIAGLG